MKKMIKDDNLRLVLSVGHQKWLNGEAHHHKVSVFISAGLLGLNLLLWIVAQGMNNPDGILGILFILLLLSPIWLCILAKACWELHKIGKWRTDHRAFLARYNRTPEDYARHQSGALGQAA